MKKKIKLILFDTGGAERFHSISLQLLRKAQGIILVFNVASKSSFDNLNIWLKEVKEFKEISSSIPIILFGNKVDINKDKWEVTSEEAKNFAEKMEFTYFEVSAKDNKGIKEGISYFVNNVYERLEEEKKNPQINIQNQLNDDKSKCVGKGKNNKKKSK